MSKEENLGLDSLKYIRRDICWGKFAENQLSDAISLSNNAFSCATGIQSGPDDRNPRHSGSTLCIFDADGDNDMDVLVGDLSSSKLKLLFNGGTKDAAWMTKQDINFPEKDIHVNLDIFLSAFYVDADGDGIRDLVVTPNDAFSGESENHVWLYNNIGTDKSPIFKFIKNNFLIDEMAFFNSASHPSFADINGDGLIDMLIGSNGIQRKNGLRENRLYLLLNNGTKSNPQYNIVDENYLNFSAYNDLTGRFAPAFGDLDGDNDLDLLIGDVRGFLYYLENAAGLGKPMQFKQPVYQYFNIFIGQNAKPQIIDLDKDGLPDIVIGEKNNQLNFVKNIGSKTVPKFSSNLSILPNTEKLGNIYASGNDFETQSGSPFIIGNNDKFLMLLGIEIGNIMAYDQIEGNLYNNFRLLETKIGNINQGRRVIPALSDIDDDGFYEMAIGNERGGLSFFNTLFKVGTLTGLSDTITTNTSQLKIYPNPANDYFIISSEAEIYNIKLLDIKGSKISDLEIKAITKLILILFQTLILSNI